MPEFGATAQAREEFLFRGGFTVRTALDPEAMGAVSGARKGHWSRPTGSQPAIAVVVPGTGACRCSRRTGPGAARRRRDRPELVLPALPAYQPGSTSRRSRSRRRSNRGSRWPPAINSPSPYRPRRPVPPARRLPQRRPPAATAFINAYQATAGSVNTWYIRVAEKTGVLPVANLARAPRHLVAAPQGPARDHAEERGTDAWRVRGVAGRDGRRAYATFAANGVHCRPTAILGMTNTTGAAARKTPRPSCHQVISPGVATAVTSVLGGVLDPGGTGANGLGLSGREAAGKTGTTDNHGGTWFAGYTPQFSYRGVGR